MLDTLLITNFALGYDAVVIDEQYPAGVQLYLSQCFSQLRGFCDENIGGGCVAKHVFLSAL